MGSTALTATGMAALRRAAVMAHTVGTVSLRLSAAGGPIVDVRPDTSAPSHGVRRVDPCGFRMAVARSWADHGAGREVALVGLGPTEPLAIEWHVDPPGAHLGFGAIRSTCGGRAVWACASVLDPDELAAALLDVDDDLATDVAEPPEGLVARLVHDELLDATVVHLEADPPAPTRALDEVLRRMVAAVGAAEVARAKLG